MNDTLDANYATAGYNNCLGIVRLTVEVLPRASC